MLRDVRPSGDIRGLTYEAKNCIGAVFAPEGVLPQVEYFEDTTLRSLTIIGNTGLVEIAPAFDLTLEGWGMDVGESLEDMRRAYALAECHLQIGNIEESRFENEI
jgi:hypothetical protein